MDNEKYVPDQLISYFTTVDSYNSQPVSNVRPSGPGLSLPVNNAAFIEIDLSNGNFSLGAHTAIPVDKIRISGNVKRVSIYVKFDDNQEDFEPFIEDDEVVGDFVWSPPRDLDGLRIIPKETSDGTSSYTINVDVHACFEEFSKYLPYIITYSIFTL